MKYICITEIDAGTGNPCTVAPMANGPRMPVIKGLDLDWSDMSTWPVEVDSAGVYLRAPKYYGTCDDDADLTVPGVIGEITQAQFFQLKHDEFYARQPYPSWIWNAETFVWSCPVPYPEGVNPGRYKWDEDTLSWRDPMEDSL